MYLPHSDINSVQVSQLVSYIQTSELPCLSKVSKTIFIKAQQRPLDILNSPRPPNSASKFWRSVVEFWTAKNNWANEATILLGQAFRIFTLCLYICVSHNYGSLPWMRLIPRQSDEFVRVLQFLTSNKKYKWWPHRFSQSELFSKASFWFIRQSNWKTNGICRLANWCSTKLFYPFCSFYCWI